MKLKRYLRGLGIGIIVTALIVGISSNSKGGFITDEEIKSRAKDLGMVEQVEVESLEKEESAEVTSDEDSNKNEGIDLNLEAETQFIDEVDLIEDSKVLTDLEEEIETPEVDSNDTYTEDDVKEEDEIEEFVILTIHNGESSYTVSEELQNLEVIEDASEFDTYLCTNGYATRIHVGDHEIPMDATYEEIADILCSSE